MLTARSRANGRSILRARVQRRHPGLAPDAVERIVNKGGTVQEQNEAFGRTGSNYQTYEANGVIFAGMIPLGPADNPEVIAQAQAITEQGGLSVDDAIDAAVTRETSTAAQVIGQSGRAVADAGGAVVDGAGSVARTVGRGARTVVDVGSDLIDSVGNVEPNFEDGGQAVRQIAAPFINPVRRGINRAQNAIRDFGDDVATEFQGVDVNRPDIPLNLIDTGPSAPEPGEVGYTDDRGNTLTSVDTNGVQFWNAADGSPGAIVAPPGIIGVRAEDGTPVSYPDPATQTQSISQPQPQPQPQALPSEGVSAAAQGAATNRAVVSAQGAAPTSRFSKGTGTVDRVASQAEVFEKLAVNLDPSIAAEEQKIRDNISLSNERAQQDNRLREGVVAQNALENVRVGSAFQNLDNLNGQNFATGFNDSLAGIRGIGNGTSVPSVSDLASVVKSRNALTDTLKANQDVLDNPYRIEIAARQEAVDFENQRRSLSGLPPISFEDTLDPGVRQDGFEAARERIAIASVLPNIDQGLKDESDNAIEALEEQQTTGVLQNQAEISNQQLLDFIGQNPAITNFINNGLMNQFRSRNEQQ